MKDISQNIAKTLKSARARLGWSLTLTASKTGVSKAMLGQIERQESSPTVSILWKIASGMNIPFSVFISSAEERDGVLPQPSISTQNSATEATMIVKALFPYDTNLRFEILVIELEAGGFSSSSPHEDGVIEHVIVVSGVLELDVNGILHRLSAGDGLCFSADCPHFYRNRTSDFVRFHNIIHYPERTVKMNSGI